jgi:hypothetical protein
VLNGRVAVITSPADGSGMPDGCGSDLPADRGWPAVNRLSVSRVMLSPGAAYATSISVKSIWPGDQQSMVALPVMGDTLPMPLERSWGWAERRCCPPAKRNLSVVGVPHKARVSKPVVLN